MCFLHLQNCRATPQNCLLVTCDISGLQGQGANRAKVTLPGYVDDRFFAVSLGMEVCTYTYIPYDFSIKLPQITCTFVYAHEGVSSKVCDSQMFEFYKCNT